MITRTQRLHRFNWFILLGCMLLYAIGGTLSAVGAIILAGNPMVTPFAPIIALGMSGGLYAAALCALLHMERC